MSIEEFQELLEDLEDLAIVAERRQEPTISHEQLVSDLKKEWPFLRSSGRVQRCENSANWKKTIIAKILTEVEKLAYNPHPPGRKKLKQSVKLTASGGQFSNSI